MLRCTRTKKGMFMRMLVPISDHQVFENELRDPKRHIVTSVKYSTVIMTRLLGLCADGEKAWSKMFPYVLILLSETSPL